MPALVDGWPRHDLPTLERVGGTPPHLKGTARPTRVEQRRMEVTVNCGRRAPRQDDPAIDTGPATRSSSENSLPPSCGGPARGFGQLPKIRRSIAGGRRCFGQPAANAERSHRCSANALAALGYADGRHLRLDFRCAKATRELQARPKRWWSKRPTVIVTLGNAPTRARATGERTISRSSRSPTISSRRGARG